jgi:hypothetical protein
MLNCGGKGGNPYWQNGVSDTGALCRPQLGWSGMHGAEGLHVPDYGWLTRAGAEGYKYGRRGGVRN